MFVGPGGACEKDPKIKGLKPPLIYTDEVQN
jgi:hypothetical protein